MVDQNEAMIASFQADNPDIGIELTEYKPVACGFCAGRTRAGRSPRSRRATRTRRAQRERSNTWREKRGIPALDDPRPYTDHHDAIVEARAPQTGLRFGELTGLRWQDVDLTRRIVTVVTAHAKSGKARHVPLNDEALRVLKTWRTSDVTPTGYVFRGQAGGG